MAEAHQGGTVALDHGGLRGRSVIVIDDDIGVRSALTMVLDTWGCSVLGGGSIATVERGIQAIPFAPDVIVADLHLDGPQSEPCEIAIHQFAKRISFHGPVIVITGNSRQICSKQIQQKGWTLLIKPFPPGDLLRAMAKGISPLATQHFTATVLGAGRP